jgi:hypothetical protein
VITAQTWDTVALGYGPGINDQGQCGDCYLNSAANVCASAQMVAGVAPKGSAFQLSIQYLLDCHSELGGCGGGDEYQVSQLIQTSGCPSMAQYSGQGQNPGNCKGTTGMQMYTVSGLMMCSTGTGVANTQDIKNCIAANGYASVAVAAGEDWDSYQAGQVLTGTNTSVNHAVGIVGWKTSGTTTIWKGQNSWGTSWGDGGYFWIQEGADSIGTEAYVAIVTPVTPPPPPVPPGPTPPTPPGPTPAPGAATTLIINNAMAAGTYEIAPQGNLAAWQNVQQAVQASPVLQQAMQGKAPGMEPPLLTPTVQPSLDAKRLDALEAGMLRLTDSFLELQRTIQGKPK